MPSEKTQSKTMVDFLENTVDDELTTVSQIEELIDKHLEAIQSAETEISRCRERIAFLNDLKDSLTYGDMTLVYRLADALHRQGCNSSECSWDSYSWSNYNGGEREEYLMQSKMLIEISSQCGIPDYKCLKFFESVIDATSASSEAQ